MKRGCIVAALVFVAAMPVVAQYDPPAGGEDLYDLFSAALLSEAGPELGGAGPQADVLNPATSALEQRTTLDASYLALVGLGPLAGGGWQGHVANLGIVSPTRVGVFSGSVHFLTMPLSGMPWGTMVSLNASAAKELYPGWLFGAGLRVTGGGYDQFDVGAGLDLGLIREIGDLGPLGSVRWGVALQNLGKWYTPNSAAGALPGPFTPATGISFDALTTDWLKVRASASLSAPSFQDLRLGLGADATLFDAVSLHTGWKIGLREMVDPAVTARSLIPSFGLTASFKAGLGNEGFAAERGWNETNVATTVAAAPLYNDIWAMGGGINAPLGIIDTNGPRVSVAYGQPVYISPNNDGMQDALVVPIEITDERFVMGWTFEVRDASGTVVRTIANKDDRPENTGFQNIVDRLVYVRTGVAVPPQIRWDGGTDAGVMAPDGQYSFQLSAIDDNGNRGSSASYRVYVDSTPPQVQVVQSGSEQRIFSPNGDGNKDVLTIDQSGSAEQLWNAAIVNAAGLPVRTFAFTDQAPAALTWDGRGDDGAIRPDGVYRYRITATDQGGNTASAELANIILNTEATPVALRISDPQFSPNGDGRKDTITITPDVPNTVGVTDWSIVVRSNDGDPVRTYHDVAGAPAPVVFDGRTDDGRTVAERTYFAELDVSYRNGNRPTAQSASFTVDLTPPLADARADVPLFSPNGDGNIDSVTFFNEASREERWRGTIIDSKGTAIRTYTWSAIPDQRVVWSGRQDDGRLAPDGTYRYILSAEDLAGNVGASVPVVVELSTAGAEIGLRAEFEAFSPNADGVRDQQKLFPRVDRAKDVATYRVDIVDSTGSAVRSFDGRGEPAANVTWDGTYANGRRVPDGNYRGKLSATFTNGVELTAQTAQFTVDTMPPTVSVALGYDVFSPDGDGNRDTVRIQQSTSAEDSWHASIRNAKGDPVRDYLWSGIAPTIDWDGTDSAGNKVSDGIYSYEISATDRAGNTIARGVPGITVDTRVPRLFVTATANAFSPNGDGARDTVAFDLYANLLDGSSGWKLTIRSDAGLVVRQFSGTDLTAERTIAWDGKDGRGQIREGNFVAEYTVDYVKGNHASVTSSAVRLDISPPDVEVGLKPVPFSPDNDGVDDDLSIGISVTDASPIQAWQFEILDRNHRFFNEFSGKGRPAQQLIWDGRASDGELVISAEDYPYELTVSDDLGNRTTVTGVIPVDILVIRDGDRLKVQIANITFAPNTPALVLDPNDERGAKNQAIIQRLTQIFEKYSSYSIRVEGHAVNVSGTEREEREELQPLSLARAQSVKDALVAAGIVERRISVLGRGGTEPIVPHTDVDNRWKNRRVEFILIR